MARHKLGAESRDAKGHSLDLQQGCGDVPEQSCVSWSRGVLLFFLRFVLAYATYKISDDRGVF